MKKILLTILLFSMLFILGCGNPYKIRRYPGFGSQKALDRAYLECKHEASLATTNLRGATRGFERAMLIGDCIKLKEPY